MSLSEKVVIPFQEEFREKMLSGQKTQTSHTKRYGYEGDTFGAFGATFQLTGVRKKPLWIVAEHYYSLEGFFSPDAFKIIWKRLHPRRGYMGMDKVWVHRFKRVEGA